MRGWSRTRNVVCTALVLVSSCVQAQDNRDAVGLVEDMSLALRSLNYEGTFVHMQGQTISSMYVLHTSDSRGELERMVALDGEAREVIRDHALVTCIWPGSDAVVRSKSRPRRLLPEGFDELVDNTAYQFLVFGEDRVAGLDTDVVDVRPRDAYRYGHRFWIERDTRMLLRSMLLDGERAVEQMMFTTIEFPEQIERSRFKASVGGSSLSWVVPVNAYDPEAAVAQLFTEDRRTRGLPSSPRDIERATMTTEINVTELMAPVNFEGLPFGYSKLSQGARSMSPGDDPTIHVMLSDGMASVSVYVQRATIADQDTSIAGLSRMGAINAYGLSLEKGFVTVVGEVPAETVRMIAQAVRLGD